MNLFTVDSFFRRKVGAGSDAADHLVVVRKAFDWIERTKKNKCSLRVLWDVGDMIQQHRPQDYMSQHSSCHRFHFVMLLCFQMLNTGLCCQRQPETDAGGIQT